MKIFGIGLSKTGTTSLKEALTILGYKSIHYPWSMLDIHNHDASLDIPVACRYKELDKLYPNSKFILTTRPFDEWILKRKKKPKDKEPQPKWKLDTRILMYGSINYDEKLYTEAYHRHHNDVYDYFANRNDLLVLPLYDKNKWELLCNFLNKEIPNLEYPWENKTLRLFL